MALTDVNVQELNNMNEAARRANLGTMLKGIEEGGAPAPGEKVPHQSNSTATDVAGIVADFNALLAKLQAAGVMA